MKQFEITDDNRPFLEARGKIVLNACPGSGKTTAIAYKLTKLIDECAEIYGVFAGIACLSFTNVAKTEITTKFQSLTGGGMVFPNVVLTLDSFINQYITLPFYYLFKTETLRPTILDVVSFLDDMKWGDYKAVNGRPLSKVLKASKIKVEIDGSFTWNGHVPKTSTVDSEVFTEYAKSVKRWQLDKGYLDNEDSTFLAYRLLRKHPEIARSLVARFPYIIVDEAQDTSEIQYSIFDLLIAGGLKNLEYVGDPYQSLYEFREARPDLFLNRFSDNINWQPLRLTDCRRTSQKIINVYSIFRSESDTSIVSACKHESNHQVKVLRYDPGNLEDLITRYESLVELRTDNHILVRGTTHLEMFGVKPPSENPWKNSAAITLIEAQKHYLGKRIKAAIDTLRIFVTQAHLSIGTYRDYRNRLEALRLDTDLNIQLFEFFREMPTIDDTLKGWTDKVTESLFTKLKLTIDLGLKQKGKKFYGQNLKALLFPTPNVKYPVSTIHKIKGRTFQSVLLVLSEDSKGANISLADFRRPTRLPTEKQRMIYVALSRPESLACIAVPNSVDLCNILAMLGDDVDFA